ncbi:hypothetical protein EHI42_20505 [Rhizobium hidalgonense]|uniref:hypothetical protein n=1 Tax=Rhizobium hidalgonense TaxID=1538159 RepID=UPI000FEC8C33|nr:hypothetical protein [Rhizobium hidalgonense]RWX13762.1 hypothetical protein EHI42_20505 [Rhizobium hidalgonense]
MAAIKEMISEMSRIGILIGIIILALFTSVTLAEEHSSRLYFQGSSADGYGLWTSDGTEANTKEITPAEGSFNKPSDLTVLDHKLIFFAKDESGNVRLWRTDGTSKGTKEIIVRNGHRKGVAGSGNLNHTPKSIGLVEYNGVLFFRGTNIDGRFGLWKTDGTSNGTFEVFAQEPTSMTVANNSLYFSTVSNNTKEITRWQIWKTDGKTTSLELDEDGDHKLRPRQMVGFRGKLYFQGLAEAQRQTLCSLSPERDYKCFYDVISPSDLWVDRNTNILLFSAYGPRRMAGLWKSDGTEAGTEEVLVKGADLLVGLSPYGFFAAFDKVLMAGCYSHDTHGGKAALWVTDMTPEGTRRIRVKGSASDVGPNSLTMFQGAVYFLANGAGARRPTLWRLDWNKDHSGPGVAVPVPGFSTGGRSVTTAWHSLVGAQLKAD